MNRYTCEEVFRRLDDYLDRELSQDEMQSVKEHLSVCARCAAESVFEGSVINELKAKLRRIMVPPDLLAQVARALSEA
jgi:anti-sigma factor (TIGR02949 family)